MARAPKKYAKIRIIGGEFRSRSLIAPSGEDTRPSASRTREAIFDLLIRGVLSSGFVDLRVLDLFAGSGALGFEALSRGAHTLESMDKSREAIACLKENAKHLEVLDRVRITRIDLLKNTPTLQEAPDLIFCDPPYALDATSLLQKIAAQVREGSILCYEHAQSARPVLAGPWRLRTRRTWGAAGVSIFESRA